MGERRDDSWSDHAQEDNISVLGRDSNSGTCSSLQMREPWEHGARLPLSSLNAK